MLGTMLSDNDLTNNVDIQRLLGFRPLTTNRFRVLPGSASKLMLDAREELHLQPSGPGEQVIEKAPLEKTLRASLTRQLVAKISDVVRKYRAGVSSVARSQAAVRIVALLILVYDAARENEISSLHAERRRSVLHCSVIVLL